MLPAILLLVLFASLLYGPRLWIRKVFSHYATPSDRYSRTGAETARYLLDQHGLPDVPVEKSDKGDHYDAANRVVRLKPENFDHGSLTAVTVAAHEVGHAIQHKESYQPLLLRIRLNRQMKKFEIAGRSILFLAPLMGAVTRSVGVTLLMVVGGLLALGSPTVASLINLPSEFDASFGRAMPMLAERQILHDADTQHAQRILKAAAYTYVAGSLANLLNIARWASVFRR